MLFARNCSEFEVFLPSDPRQGKPHERYRDFSLITDDKLHYFKFHISNWRAATSRLSLLEEAVYFRACCEYYDRERPLPPDLTLLALRLGLKTRAERNALEIILAEYFKLEVDGYHQKRCDAEIADYQSQVGSAKKAADARWKKPCETHATASATHPSRIADAMREPCADDANQNQNQNQNQQAPQPPQGEQAGGVGGAALLGEGADADPPSPDDGLDPGVVLALQGGGIGGNEAQAIARSFGPYLRPHAAAKFIREADAAVRADKTVKNPAKVLGHRCKAEIERLSAKRASAPAPRGKDPAVIQAEVDKARSTAERAALAADFAAIPGDAVDGLRADAVSGATPALAGIWRAARADKNIGLMRAMVDIARARGLIAAEAAT